MPASRSPLHLAFDSLVLDPQLPCSLTSPSLPMISTLPSSTTSQTLDLGLLQRVRGPGPHPRSSGAPSQRSLTPSEASLKPISFQRYVSRRQSGLYSFLPNMAAVALQSFTTMSPLHIHRDSKGDNELSFLLAVDVRHDLLRHPGKGIRQKKWPSGNTAGCTWTKTLNLFHRR